MDGGGGGNRGALFLCLSWERGLNVEERES